jgi:hypothetical protein
MSTRSYPHGLSAASGFIYLILITLLETLELLAPHR